MACELSKRFNLWEKLWAQGSFNAMLIVATIGILRADWRAIFPFVLVAWYGVPGVMMRHLCCPRCPHLHEYGDCLQFPAFLTKKLVARRKSTPFSPAERWVTYAIFGFIPTYPLFWLRSQPVLLSLFASSAAMWYLAQWFYFCKRCRVKECPFNRAIGTC